MKDDTTKAIIRHFEAGNDAQDISERFGTSFEQTQKIIDDYLKLEYNSSDDDGDDSTDLYGNEGDPGEDDSASDYKNRLQDKEQW